MALPTLSTRPEKIINSVFLSRWNAAALPIQYVVNNTKWPDNTDDSTLGIQEVNDNNGYAEITTDVSIHGYQAKEWVKITGTSNYNGIYRVRSVPSIDKFVIDTSYIADDTGSVIKYYQNYTSLIRVYAGGTLIGTIEQRPNTDNSTYVDVRKYILSNLSTKNDINQVNFPNDENLWTSLYIEFAERYDDVIGGTVVNTISAYTSDSGDPCYASHSALQFGNLRGGNMADYLIGVTTAKWMTFFDRPTLFTGQYFDISILNAGNNTYNVIEYNINGNQVNTQAVAVPNNGVGLYRIRLDNLTFNSSTKYVTMEISDDVLETETITIDINNKCANQNLHLAWLNSLGGWEYWNFTARKTHGYDIGNVQTINRDILQNWDTDFIAGETEREHISIEAAKRVIVRSQNLTTQQVEAIARIKASIKVVDFTDPDNPITLIVDKSSFDYTTDREKLNFIQFTIGYPVEIIQSQ